MAAVAPHPALICTHTAVIGMSPPYGTSIHDDRLPGANENPNT